MERGRVNLLSKLVWPTEPASGLDTRLRQHGRALRRARRLSAKHALGWSNVQHYFHGSGAWFPTGVPY
eukprot:12988574-Alexandrium_andersonii.AAC.1